MTQYDVVVIGSGPAGMTAALYLCRFGLKVALLEKFAPGGQLLNTADIANYPGFPKGTEGWNLAETFSAHLDGYQLDRIGEEVQRLTPTGKRHHLQLDTQTIEARAVIVCTGASPRKLGLPDEERLTGKGVSYCAMCDGMFYKDQDVAMAGGGNSALEEALYLTNIVRKLYIVHRRDQFRADKIYQDRIAEHRDKIELVLSHTISGLLGEDALTGIRVQPVDGGSPREIPVSGLFVFVGTDPVGRFLPPDLELDQGGFIVTDCEMVTSIPGLFAAGDIRSKGCRQVVTAVGDGATAAHSAFAYLETLED